MSKKVLAIPKAGLIVRDPATLAALPESGAVVTLNSYWKREELDGSIELAEVEAATPLVKERKPRQRTAGKGN